MVNYKKNLGQYMTPKSVADFMVSLADIDLAGKILEPSSGEGVFIDSLKESGYTDITAYEIDSALIKNNSDVINSSFISAPSNPQYDLVIGNPPYIRWKNLLTETRVELLDNPLWNSYCNSLCDFSSIFILKAIESLKPNGQLIFITPEYWLNTTHSYKIRNYMVDNGYFENLIHFNETPIFKDANVSTVIFKYKKAMSTPDKKISVSKYRGRKKLTVKTLDLIANEELDDEVQYFKLDQFKKNSQWRIAEKSILTSLDIFTKKCQRSFSGNLLSRDIYTVGEFCDIGNGMVSGLDKAFQLKNTTVTDYESDYLIKVIKAKDLSIFRNTGFTNYFLIKDKEFEKEEEFKSKCPNFYELLKKHKDKLNSRYNYNREIKYWEWSFLRNYKLFSSPNTKIFVPSKDRITNRNHFRFSFVESGFYPTQDVTAIHLKEGTQESIYFVLAFLNSNFVFNWLKVNGIVKGDIVEFSEKPISTIPFRKIDFNNPTESQLHDIIVKATKDYISSNDISVKHTIDLHLGELFL